MPNRLLKEGIVDSEKINALSAEDEVFFYRLLVVADDFGLMDARPAIVRARCFPLKESLSAAKVEGWLARLNSVGLIARYEVDGKQWHEAGRDTERDNELWALGWRTFRIPGRESFANGYEPFDPDEMLARKHCERTAEFDHWLTKTSEGLFFCLHTVYYDEGQMLRRKHWDILGDIYLTLETHRLINFPIDLSEAADA